jgi:hypothetical protein
MEVTPDLTDAGRNNGNAEKKKRTWGNLFIDFMVSGGIIVLVVLVAALALVINLLIID